MRGSRSGYLTLTMDQGAVRSIDEAAMVNLQANELRLDKRARMGPCATASTILFLQEQQFERLGSDNWPAFYRWFGIVWAVFSVCAIFVSILQKPSN
jgi:hypothetical protein